ncbi:Crp/Fnr family transcriptional regulator [Oscillochloris sp. ZM17-4]|uniref:Crp/Fnr family transcriptional regulator n=1 Tax=Oscillochloris sp. ZM17-4 TaxID=2866714 RepID=UPI001C739CD6|nr:Crp/Fnr family transcriptional regulator [Oscillochloris sp. ZM17-4]MBX0330515.1 Crp/Fnr family transcriptional regulator [Oscillochloris sp. ZM17-4]
MTISPADLAAYPLCAGLGIEQLALVARAARRVAVMPGALLMSRAQPGDAAYLVASGTLHVLIDLPDGASVILAALGPQALVGELGVVQSAARSASVVAAERAALLAIHRDDFTALLRAIPALALNLNAILAQRLRLANAQILAMGAGDPSARVARTLLTFAGEHGVPRAGGVGLPFRLTQSDLARMTGLARASVNKVVGELARRQVLRSDTRQHLTLIDLAALEELAQW